jgi:hypothetical protein
LVRKIFTFYINDVLLFKCPFPGPKAYFFTFGEIRSYWEYQEYFLGRRGGGCLGLTNLPPSCTDCLEIW